MGRRYRRFPGPWRPAALADPKLRNERVGEFI